MSEPQAGFSVVDRRHFLAAGVAAATVGLLDAEPAAAHGHATAAVLATLADSSTDYSFAADAIPTGRRFEVILEPGAQRVPGLREGDAIAVQPTVPMEVDADTVGESGAIVARGVARLVVGTRDDIADRAPS